MLRMRLNRDERGLVVAVEQVTQREYQAEPKHKYIVEFLNRQFQDAITVSQVLHLVLTSSTKNVHVDLLQQTHHKSIDLR